MSQLSDTDRSLSFDAAFDQAFEVEERDDAYHLTHV